MGAEPEPAFLMEQAVRFPGGEGGLCGVLHRPEGKALGRVLLVTGGPQSRVASHRMYVQLARYLAARGFACLRFDLQGAGDSPGAFLGYHRAALSIRPALDRLEAEGPEDAPILLWSLCDGAAAAAVYARHDARLSALVLSNPYILSEQVRSRTYLKHYYLGHLREKAFWIRLFTFRVNPFKALSSLAGLARKALVRGGTPAAPAGSPPGCFEKADVREEVLRGACAFPGRIHFLLSADDLTAKAFRDMLDGDAAARSRLAEGRFAVSVIEGADHTFSSAAFKERAFQATLGALRDALPAASIPATRSL